ncbi:MAG: TetR/AcrR family transcriptional regulator [Proteobacteria bacterium]|nr:TetR/AcrR family transcriptional regulator [Pseudomonadota bacterium]MBU4382530.1 TetR/AcrR family transcriptional regulator [Pseudomonadota bacterium]MBU4606170.1 TetR/AcrR family transcriptional regulator [Pseudomonadota bacterium]
MGVAERRAREKEQRREAILDAAKEIFSRKGYQGATMEEIAARAELSPATLYLYFDNKSQLYASLNVKMLAFLCHRVEQVAGQKGLEPLEKVRRLAQAMHDVYTFDPLILINVLHMQASQELMDLSPELKEQINSMAARALQVMAGIFQQGIEQGLFRPYPPVALADLVWSVFSGLVLWEESKRGFAPEKDYLQDTLELAIEIMARGVSK